MEEHFDYLLALGLLAFLWPKASKHNSAKQNTIKQGVLLFFFVLSLVGVPLNKTKQQNNKTTNNNNKQQQQTNNKQQQI